MNIGTRIKKARRMQARTLQDVADHADITKSLLSKIENNKSTPPVATLTRIAQALGVHVNSLLHDTVHGGTVFIPAQETLKTAKTDKGYDFFNFASQRSSDLMAVYLFSAEKGQVNHKQKRLSHSGEEFIYVVEGRMHFSVGGRVYDLQTGDALHFDSEEDHDFEPISDHVKYLAVFCARPQNNG